jgi:phosphatidylinositol-3-phosphatase
MGNAHKEVHVITRRLGRKIRHAVTRGLLGPVILAFILAATPQPLSAQGDDRDEGRGFNHVFVIMMENTGFGTLIGNPNAPFTNAAAANFGLASNYFGVTHPSQPNYIAATSGSTNGVTNDNDTIINVANIVDQLEANGKTWKAYMQSYSLCTTKFAHACGIQLYERKHNPFISYQDVQSNPARVAKIVDFSQFATDLASGNVADYTWISPDQCNDMHGRGGTGIPNDPCDFSQVQGLIAAGDSFLLNTVNAILNSKAWRGNSVIFITWDEADFTGSGFQGFGDDSGCCDSVAGQGGGHVVTLVISKSIRRARTSDDAANHYSMLSTIEDGWDLGCLGFTCDRENVKPMTDLVRRGDD